MDEHAAARAAAGGEPLRRADAAGGDLPGADAKPGILLADEPVASLDPKNAQRIMDVLREISEQGISVMVNLHSVELVRAYCTRVIGVASGQLIFDDHPSRLTQDVLQRLYGDEVSQLH